MVNEVDKSQRYGVTCPTRNSNVIICDVVSCYCVVRPIREANATSRICSYVVCNYGSVAGPNPNAITINVCHIIPNYHVSLAKIKN